MLDDGIEILSVFVVVAEFMSTSPLLLRLSAIKM